MTAEERRVIEALQAHTGGLIVTDQDVNHAQLKLNEKLESTPKRPSTRPFIIGAAAVVVLIAGVVGALTLGGDDKSATPIDRVPVDEHADWLTGPDLTPQLLAGMWREDNATRHLRFTTDGRVSMDETAQVVTNPASSGAYSIDGDVITINIDEASRECGGDQLVMRGSLAEPGRAHLVVTDAGSFGCAPRLVEAAWEQVQPPNPGLGGYVPEAKWGTPANTTTDMYGAWGAARGAHVLELGRDGTYAVLVGSGDPVDRGEWTVSTSPWQLSLVSSSDTITCQAGDQLVVGQLRQSPTATEMRGTVERNDCGGAWEADIWHLIPTESRG
ncbi:MAG TPA: hypothetical protein VLI04_16235 [Nocardioidaceae bacterium]|nr:hypothetical protein [Nocardioidaceae bacterium]